MTSKITARLVTESSITIMMNGKTFILTEDNHQHYTELRVALRNDDMETIDRLIDIPKAINTYGGGIISVVNGEVIFEGKPLHNAVTTRLLNQMDEGFDVEPMVQFLSNLMKNPAMTARNELYLWLEQNQCPITEDGHFIAFKNVRDTYMDWHSNSISNAVGEKPSMPRNDVDDNRNQTCSAGLHFCSESYLQHFHNSASRTMVVKVNPADVVSIPNDYNNAKGRCWTYEVISEVAADDIKNFYNSPVHGATKSARKSNSNGAASFEVMSSYDDWASETSEGTYATQDGAQTIAEDVADQTGYAVRVRNVVTDEIVFELDEDYVTDDDEEDDDFMNHETDDEPLTLDETLNAWPFPTSIHVEKPFVAPPLDQVCDTPCPVKIDPTANPVFEAVDGAPALNDMLFTKTQACAILRCNLATLDAMLDNGVKVTRMSRGGKNWVRIN